MALVPQREANPTKAAGSVLESQEPQGERSTIVRERDLRRLRMQIPAPDGAGRITVEGCTASAAQTTLALFVGTTELGTGKPGIPIARPTTFRFVATSFFGSSVPPASPWTLTLHRRPLGGSFSPAATFTVETS